MHGVTIIVSFYYHAISLFKVTSTTKGLHHSVPFYGTHRHHYSSVYSSVMSPFRISFNNLWKHQFYDKLRGYTIFHLFIAMDPIISRIINEKVLKEICI